MGRPKPNPWGWGPENHLRLIGLDGSVQFDREGVTFQPDMPEDRVHLRWSKVQSMSVEVPVFRRRTQIILQGVAVFGGSALPSRRSYFHVQVFEGWSVHEWKLAPASTVLFSQESSRATEFLFRELSNAQKLPLLGDRDRALELIREMHRVQSWSEIASNHRMSRVMKRALAASNERSA